MRAALFERDGYLIVRGLWPAEEAAGLRDHYMRIHARRAIAGYDDGLPDTDILHAYPRLVHPHRTDLVSRRSMLDSRIERVLCELFGEWPLAAHSMLFYKPPGGRGVGLHRDHPSVYSSPKTCIGCWIALDRADAENGAMLVVPGSHRLDGAGQAVEVNEREFYNVQSLRVPEGHRLMQTELNPGDALFFSGHVMHGSYANRSRGRFRRCFIGHYVARSTRSVAKFYHPLLAFSGEEVSCGVAAEGFAG